MEDGVVRVSARERPTESRRSVRSLQIGRCTLQLAWMLILLIVSACSPAPASSTPTSPTLKAAATKATPAASSTSAPTPSPGATLTLPSSLTIDQTPTFEVGLSATPSGSRLDRYQKIYYNDIPPALEWMLLGEYSRAIALWDQIIADLPGYGYVYYQRGRSYYLYALQSSAQAETMDALGLALKDVNRSIELGPLVGDLYLLRYEIYRLYARLEPVRENSQEWLQLALQDARQANSLGNSNPDASLYPGSVLNDMGRCQEALDEFSSLVVEVPDGARRADLNAGLARSYLCFGRLDAALTHIDLALEIQPTTTRQMTKAVILFNMGELQSALALLNAWIEAELAYYPERYFFRALIYYDLGMYDLARADQEYGLSQVNDVRGVGAYVQGLLALQDGDREGGRKLIEYAEQSLDYGYGPLLNRVRGELGLPLLNFGAPRIPPDVALILTATPEIQAPGGPALTSTLTATLTATSSLSQTVALPKTPQSAVTLTPTGHASLPATSGATKQPTRASTPTPPSLPTLAATVTPYPTPTRAFTVTPYPMPTLPARIAPPVSAEAEFSLPAHFVFRDLSVPYTGSGPFELGAQPGGITFFFQPDEEVALEAVDSLNVHLELADEVAQPNLFFLLFRYEGLEILIGGQGIQLYPGENSYPAFRGFVQQDGSVFVRLINRSGAPLEIADLGLSLAARMADGSQRVLGFQSTR
jgi:tetratricopeptide (TPR) repeat protein